MNLLANLHTLRSQIVFHLVRKPRYLLLKDENDINFERGILCISADLELAWAWRYDRNSKINSEKIGLQERENTPKILKKLDELQIPITWAIVGHLFLKSCERKNGVAHPEMPRPDYFKNAYWEFKKGDWYEFDACTDYKSAPAWYAPDLIESILNSKVKHEIACHTFSHIGFNERYCPKELAEAEIIKCNAIMLQFGIKPVSMIFPGEEAGYFELLVRHGYKYMRYFPLIKVEISRPIKLKEGIWAILVSSNIIPDENWNSGYILWRLKKYVDKAIEKKALCHFWFHPSISKQRIEEALFPILEYCAKKKEEGKLDIMTMKEVGELMECKAKALPNNRDQIFTGHSKEV